MKEEYLLSFLSEKNQMVRVMDTNQYTQRFGLMLSEQEAELLAGKDYQKKIAKAIATGIDEYLRNAADGT